MLLDSLMAIIISGAIGPNAATTYTYYITPELMFIEGEDPVAGQTYALHDFQKMKCYSFSGKDLRITPIEIREPGKERGWKVVDQEVISREIIDTAIFLGYECMVSEEIHESPDIFQPENGKKSRHSYRFYACRIPELEAMPPQVRLHLYFYKEWKWPEYPYELRQWSVDEDKNRENILSTISSIEKGLFPMGRAKNLFPEWEKDVDINRLKQAAIELKAFLDQLKAESHVAEELKQLMAEKLGSNPNYGRLLSGVFPEDWRQLIPPKAAPRVPSERNLQGVSFDQLPDYIHRVITEGGNDNFLVIILDAEKNYYLQLRPDQRKEKLTLEAVSNNYLVTEMQLSDKQIQFLGQQGFDLPDHPERNFKLEFPHDPEIVGSLVQKIEKIAIEVYGLSAIEKREFELLLVLE